jgi:hypothetical protein
MVWAVFRRLSGMAGAANPLRHEQLCALEQLQECATVASDVLSAVVSHSVPLGEAAALSSLIHVAQTRQDHSVVTITPRRVVQTPATSRPVVRPVEAKRSVDVKPSAKASAKLRPARTPAKAAKPVPDRRRVAMLAPRSAPAPKRHQSPVSPMSASDQAMQLSRAA